MTQYNEILNITLGLNVLAIAYRCRCRLHRYLFVLLDLLRVPSISGRKFSSRKVDNSNGIPHDDASKATATADTTSTKTLTNEMSRRHARLLYGTYLPVYLMAVAADWLQGAYKYSVYSAYGYDQRAISILFVAGFGSGMFLGSVTGSLADTWGRRRMACVYCVVYMLSCLAKHFRPFWILLTGRVLGGIATSLLFSVFDSWLIRAHAIQNIDRSYLSQSFSVANFGSSVVAIISGLLANWVVGDNHHATKNDDDNNSATELRPLFWRAARRWAQEQAFGDHAGPPQQVDDPRWNAAFVYKGGGIRAFDLAQVPLFLSFMLALALWDENYGHQKETDSSSSSSGGTCSQQKGRKQDNMLSALRAAMTTVWRSPSIFNLCAISSFFEGAMYVFILLWTPALRAVDVHSDVDDYPGPPLGIVFATFMVCCMLGTSVFSMLTSVNVPPARILVFCLLLSTASCAVISQTRNDTACYCAMLLFEFCIGAYYPAMSTVKGSIIAEDQRAAIYSVFRLPLNAVVLVNLLFTTQGYQHSFTICAAMLGLATVLQMQLARWEGRNQTKQEAAEMALLL